MQCYKCNETKRPELGVEISADQFMCNECYRVTLWRVRNIQFMNMQMMYGGELDRFGLEIEMNERIELLAKQAEHETKKHFDSNWDGTPREIFDMYFNEKFAQLIVRECAEVCRKQSFHYAEHNNKGSAASAADVCRILIKQHFGVEE